MLVPYFAPQTHAAMFRAHKLAKYLPAHGFRPVVVTTDINYLYNNDAALLGELPSCVQVHRARFIEPTVRGIRMALGGQDRTFAALKSLQPPKPLPTSVDGSVTTEKRADKRSALSSAELVRLLGEWPDRHWTWSLAAKSMCQRLIREQGIRVIYTSAVPISPLRVAAQLKTEFNLLWLADYRDPVGYGKKHSAQGLLASEVERRIISRAMREADAVTGLAASYGSIFHDLYQLPESRYHFIPTGLDEAYLGDSTQPTAGADVILHVGEVMPNQSAYVFEVLAQAMATRPAEMKRFKLVFVGRREVNEPLIRQRVSSLPGWDMPIEFVDHVPQAKVYEMARAARACLLTPGRGRFWWTNFAKLVDYMALGVPVIADVPRISEAREELSKTGQAFFLDGDEPQSDAEALTNWLSSSRQVARSAYGQRYTANAQAAEFAQVLGDLLKGNPHP